MTTVPILVKKGFNLHEIRMSCSSYGMEGGDCCLNIISEERIQSSLDSDVVPKGWKGVTVVQILVKKGFNLHEICMSFLSDGRG